MRDVVLYAPEDQHYLEQLFVHLRDMQAVQSGAALDTLRGIALRRVLLLMSIDLLYRLECEADYSLLYQQLKLFEREGMVTVVPLRSCHWEESFEHCAVLPSGGPTIATLCPAAQEVAYQEIAAALALF